MCTCVFWARESADKWKPNKRTCCSHYNVNEFWNCIILSGGPWVWLWTQTQPLTERSVGYPCRLQHCDTWGVGGGEIWLSRMWHHACSAWCRTTSRPAVLKQSQQTSLGGFMTHWLVFPRTRVPEGILSACVCLQCTLKPPCLHNQLQSTVRFIGK